jgi:hypothetical protein
VTFWNEFVVLSDPDRLRGFFIPENVANLVHFAQIFRKRLSACALPVYGLI